jgi:transaldolase
MFNFLIDTADIKYIENKWQELNGTISGKNILGITTNPNAFYKTNDFTIEEWKNKSLQLCSLIKQIRGDSNGTLHVQFPNSNLTEDLFIKWINIVQDFTNGDAKLAIKIPPFKKALEIATKHRNNYDLNVTGISDAGTAIFSLSHDIKYASIIPGRMEEVGIDAKSHVSYAVNSNKGSKKIITGSMRTLDGFRWCVEYNTIPTVGTRVLDLINQDNVQQLLEWSPLSVEATKFMPTTNNLNFDLSNQFFEQMDSMGRKAYEGLL